MTLNIYVYIIMSLYLTGEPIAVAPSQVVCECSVSLVQPGQPGLLGLLGLRRLLEDEITQQCRKEEVPRGGYIEGCPGGWGGGGGGGGGSLEVSCRHLLQCLIPAE